jgi:hypothetical protein
MSTKKILKFYLISTLTLTSMAALSFTDTFKKNIPYYYTSVFDTEAGMKPLVETNNESIAVEIDSNEYRENPTEIMLTMSSDAGKSLATTGAKDVNFMNLSLKTSDTDVVLNGVAFKIIGANGQDIKNAYLVDGEAIVATATITKSKIKFPNMGYEIKAGTDANLQLKVDLGEEIPVGRVISLEIENPDDINTTVNGGSYSLNGHYPITGKYLSIAAFK